MVDLRNCPKTVTHLFSERAAKLRYRPFVSNMLFSSALFYCQLAAAVPLTDLLSNAFLQFDP